jgi:hypothetical protein
MNNPSLVLRTEVTASFHVEEKLRASTQSLLELIDPFQGS